MKTINPLKWFQKKQKRSYTGADTGRLLYSWLHPSTSPDAEMYGVLSVLRDRSRELYRNNDYAKKFIKMCVTNIVGPNGIILQNKSRNPDSDTLDKNANDEIEKQWKEWSRRGNCTVCGKLSWLDLQSLIVESCARDGEVIIRKIGPWDNQWKFSLQVLEADYLDESLNDKEQRISMGVQTDSWGRPIYYHLLKKHPGDRDYIRTKKEYAVFPANEILHIYRIERPGQTRGIPWIHSSMVHLHHLEKYEEAELVAARVGAAKMLFYTRQQDTLAGIVPDDRSAAGNLVKDVEPGTAELLPPGVSISTWEPEHPANQFATFNKAVLRGIAAGCNVSYNSLANDLESVNYSSYRAGSLEERDNWRILQSWFIRFLCEQIFPEWLYWSMISGTINLPMRKFEQFNAANWMARGWDWVDPEKDIEAARKAILSGFNTKTRVAAERGEEFEDILEQLKRENELEREYGVELKLEKPSGGGFGAGQNES